MSIKSLLVDSLSEISQTCNSTGESHPVMTGKCSSVSNLAYAPENFKQYLEDMPHGSLIAPLAEAEMEIA